MEYNPYTDNAKFMPITGNPYALNSHLTDSEIWRANAEMTMWNFYRGYQWRTKRPDVDPQITVNYCKAFVDKGVAFLMSKPFSLGARLEAIEVIKPLLDTVWEDNQKSLISLDIGQAGGVTGNAWVKVVVEQFDAEEQADMLELYPQGRIRIIVLPTYTVFPTWHSHDRDKMIKCTIMYPVTVESPRVDGKIDKKTMWYREVITPTTITEYFDDEVIEERENVLREIPIVRIKNKTLSGESLGLSDIQDIIPLQVELNRKATDVSDIINYHSAPVTIIQGARVAALEKGAKKMWGGLPKDAKVFNLELQSDLDAAMNYLEMIKTSMFELSHMPEDAFGKKTNISNTSGIALHIKNQPLMEATKMKWVTYGTGIRHINRLILKYARLIGHPLLNVAAFDALSPEVRYFTTVEFQNPLPKDELIQMQLIAQKISLMLLSRKQAIAELGSLEAEAQLNEILAEAQKIQNMVYAEPAQDAQDINIGGIVADDERVDRQ